MWEDKVNMKIDDLLKKLPPDNFGKGDAFEKLVKWWLQNDSVWKGLLKPNTVKLWNESPHRQGRDIGIDLTAEDYLGHVWAIQAKNWKEETSLPKSEIDKFLSASNTRKFQKRLLVTTTSSISSNAVSAMDHQEKEAKKVTIHDLRESNVEWQLYFDNPKANATKAIKIPFPHQKDAIKNTVKGLKENKRGQLIMACGSGKTITAQRIDEELESKLTLVLVPSLLLVQQTLKSWREETRKDFLSMAVCSDDTVTNDSAVGKVSDLSIPVTTDSKEIKEFLKLKGRKVIFSTYQSSSKIAKAIKGTKYKFDLVIADEAHRLAGTVDKEYGSVLQKNALPSKHYLFMTATPRIFTANVQKTASERGVEVYSMDDETIFGKQLHDYSFADAIRDGVLTDYRVVVVGVDDPMLADMIDQRELVRAGDIDTDAKTLASHIGLAKAMRDYKLNRVISFHSRIKSAKTFAEQHPKIREWMKEPNIKSTNLTTLTISGQDSSDARKRVLDQLKEVDSNSQGLVTNARCLTEGVDVPTLDGIAFIDPRASQVDIVQAVGRAIRRGGDEKKFGYIVIPIFFSQKDIDEEVINESAFKPIWDVINALKSHDSKLSDEIDEMRINLGRLKKPQEISEKVDWNLPKNLDSTFVEKINILVVEKTTSVWDESYGAFLEFIAKYNHARPTRNDISETGINLGVWVENNRSRKKFLSKERINKLEISHPTWTWDPHDDAWNQGFSYLGQYIKEFGNCRVTQKYVNIAGFKLGLWVNGQRTNYRRKKLSSDRILLLENLHDTWSWEPYEDNWEEFYELVKDSIIEDGFINYHRIDKNTKKSIKSWVSMQRTSYRENLLSQEKIIKLENLGDAWSWEPSWDSWFGNFEILKKYVIDNKSVIIPDGIKSKNVKNMRMWITKQRAHYKKGTLEIKKIEMIQSLSPDWKWEPHDQQWNEMYEELIRFIKLENHALVPNSYTTKSGLKLGSWIERQRSLVRKKQLSQERLELLKQSHETFSWDPKEESWFNGLSEYKLNIVNLRENGIPDLFVTPTGYKLGQWIRMQRQAKRRGELDKDRLSTLEDLENWSWDPFEDKWFHNWNLLRDYLTEHKEYPKQKGFKLTTWVENQRKLYKFGKLEKQKIKKLESLPVPIVWNPIESLWIANYKEFLLYVKNKGDCQIDIETKSSSGLSIGAWTYTQRAMFKQGKLSDERTKKLEAINGWKWDLGKGGRGKKI